MALGPGSPISPALGGPGGTLGGPWGALGPWRGESQKLLRAPHARAAIFASTTPANTPQIHPKTRFLSIFIEEYIPKHDFILFFGQKYTNIRFYNNLLLKNTPKYDLTGIFGQKTPQNTIL